MSDVRWYTTLALWKSAIFLEGSYQRRLAGTTDDPFFDLLEQGVPDVAERAWRWRMAAARDARRAARRLRRRPDHQRLRVVRGVLRATRGSRRTPCATCFRDDPAARDLLADLETGRVDRGGVRGALRRAARASSRPRA